MAKIQDVRIDSFPLTEGKEKDVIILDRNNTQLDLLFSNPSCATELVLPQS